MKPIDAERSRESGEPAALPAREQRRLLAFLRKLPHDFANAILPFQIAADLLRRADGDAETLDQVQRMLEEQSAQAQRLIEELDRTVRVLRGELEVNPSPCELEPVVERGIAAALGKNAPSVRIERVFAPQPIEVEADAGRLAAAVEELVDNAARFAGSQPIRVEIDRSEAAAVVRVVDRGPGIADDRMGVLFEPFAAAEAVESGWGIGLGFVRLVARAHGGSLTVERGAQGRGMAMTIRLPLLGDG